MPIDTRFEPHAYSDACICCGAVQTFVRRSYSVRESYCCAYCGASARYRGQAQALLRALPAYDETNLAGLVNNDQFRGHKIYEPGTIGPFRSFFNSLPGYYQSDFFVHAERGPSRRPFPHQDLKNLSLEDGSFDIVITSDILEHVRRPIEALSEIYRVLTPGGIMVTTVPMQAPLPIKTVRRVDSSGENGTLLLPPNYHGNGKGGRSLVYTDFGQDVISELKRIGFTASLEAYAFEKWSGGQSTIYSIVGKKPQQKQP